jgi:hypothetical protein
MQPDLPPILETKKDSGDEDETPTMEMKTLLTTNHSLVPDNTNKMEEVKTELEMVAEESSSSSNEELVIN